MGAVVSLCSPKSTRQDEQACEAGGLSKRQIDQSAPDDLGADGKRIRMHDSGGASGAIVGCSGGQLHCSDEESESLLFSSNPRAAGSGIVLDRPSGSKENLQQLRSFQIDPAKHKIFLSHSGAQKNFVEQLCVDLEAQGCSLPFFDQRHHSLPKGKDFAPLIKRAARLCHVAVIVLSKEFLCSKWPMMELAEFYAAKQGGNHRMSMLPLFYKMVVGDLDERSIEVLWTPIWNELASRDERIDVSQWIAAVRALRRVNGLPFGKHNNSEVAYRKEIVRSIWKMLPGDLMYNTSAREMVGYNRICQTLSRRFVKCNTIKASVLGLYGTTGLGKTTLAKALCNYFAGEFEGMVCHVELGAMTRMKQVKLMLKTLCGIENGILRRLSDYRTGLALMGDCMKKKPVLLVIDNLTNDDNSRREAHEYLTIGFHRRSKVIITARSKEVLQDLLPGVEFCMSIPKLNEVEAGLIFLKSAAPMKNFSSVTDEEWKVLKLCIDKCLLESDDFEYPVGDEKPNNPFSKRFGQNRAYHPLALSALGDYFYRLGTNTNMLQWKISLERDHELMRDVLQSPSITSMIRLQFSTFSWSEQLLFLDIAFYSDLLSTSDYWGEVLGSKTLKFWVKWLAIMHEETTSVIERRLRDLKRSGMINWVDNSLFKPSVSFEFKVHSIYIEFAEWYMTEHGVSGLKNARGVFQPCGTSLGSDHGVSKCISDLVRLRVSDSPRASIWVLTSKRMRELQNLVLLQLYGCTNLRALSLAGLDSLRHLELIGLPKLVTVTLTKSSDTQEDGGIFESLVYVVFKCLDSLTHVPDLRSCTSLYFFHFSDCERATNFEGVECPQLRTMSLGELFLSQIQKPPNFRSLRCLTVLEIHFDKHVVLADAMELASPYNLKRRRHGQSGVVHDYNELYQDFDEFSDDPDACVFMEDYERERKIVYTRREKQYVKEGLSIVQKVLSYLYKHRLSRHRIYWGEIGSNLRWSFDEGDKEVLSWDDISDHRYRIIEWRFRDADYQGFPRQHLQGVQRQIQAPVLNRGGDATIPDHWTRLGL